MKPIHFILFLFFSSSTFAAVEILESSTHGPSYLDTFNNILTVNLRGNVTNPDVTLGSPQCGTLTMEDAVVDGKPTKVPKVDPSRVCEKHAFAGCNKKGDTAIYITYDAEGKEIVERKPKPNCEEARKTEVLSNPLNCQDNQSPTLIMTLQQQTTCNNNQPCSQSVTPTTSVKSFPVAQSEVDRCSPQDQNVVIHNPSGGTSMLASFKQHDHCGKRFGARRIETGNYLWDNDPRYQISVDDEGGFRIGDHTHYYFDFQKKQWCNHFTDNKINYSRETCSATFNNATIPIAYTTQSELSKRDDRSSWKSQGVVKLEVSADGKPMATIGHPESPIFEGAKLDDNKPVLKVTLSDSDTGGRKAAFELRTSNNADATVLGRVEAAPTYSLGTHLSLGSKSCDPNRCLNVSQGLLTTVTEQEIKCTDKHKLDLTNKDTNLCYSCNGITSGGCGSTTVLINRDGNSNRSSVPADPRIYKRVSDVRADLNRCDAPPSADGSSIDR